jgi:hypothetical protein
MAGVNEQGEHPDEVVRRDTRRPADSANASAVLAEAPDHREEKSSWPAYRRFRAVWRDIGKWNSVDVIQTILWKQYGAALDMLGGAIRLCPEHLWTAVLWKDVDDPRRDCLGLSLSHAVLGGSVFDRKRGVLRHQRRLSAKAARAATESILAYLDACRKKVRRRSRPDRRKRKRVRIRLDPGQIPGGSFMRCGMFRSMPGS